MRDSTSTRYLTGKSLIVLLMLGFCLLQFLPAASSGTDRSAVRPALSDRAHPAAKWSGALLLDAERQGDSILVVGDHGLILRSSNGGKDFVQVESPTRRMLTSVAIDGEVAVLSMVEVTGAWFTSTRKRISLSSRCASSIRSEW